MFGSTSPEMSTAEAHAPSRSLHFQAPILHLLDVIYQNKELSILQRLHRELGLGQPRSSEAIRDSIPRSEHGACSHVPETDEADLNKRQWLPDRCEGEFAAIVASSTSVVVAVCGTMTIAAHGRKVLTTSGQNNKLPPSIAQHQQAYNVDVA